MKATGTATAERKLNHLANETSPYLRQHATNPVDWYPWGEEALQKAKDEDKPIFLSIGYSSCHWCHVMEEESFRDDEVAALLNANFVPIKVDREERPDLDAAFMAAAQALTGNLGWPLNLILTPDKKPFFAATYLPKSPSRGMMGLTTLLPTIAEFWKDRRDEVTATSEKVMEAMTAEGASTAGGGLGEEVLFDAFQRSMEAFDERFGGFGTAPKFPTPHRLTFLLRYWARTGDQKALWMADRTLEEMRKGGIYDQLGKGFHRYSTDQAWTVPHFEKMLYDQALLAMAYLECWQATEKKEHAATAREVLDYVLENLTSADGGFFSSEDADSEGEEGKYYYWRLDELSEVLSPEEIELAERYFGISQKGNVREGEHGHILGKNVLRLASPDALSEPRFDEVRKKLLAAREKRVRPGKDDKVMTDWNGLMIAAMARGGAVLRDDKYVAAAARAAERALDKMRTEDGTLAHVLRGGGSRIPGFLDDQAFMAWGLIELFQAAQDPRWLREAIDLVKAMDKRFWDDGAGGYFQTAEGQPDVVRRRKDIYDGALPSGNSVALLDLAVLYRITEEPHLKERAEALIEAFSGTVFRAPEQYAQFLNAVDFKLGPSYSIIIAGKKGRDDTGTFFRELSTKFVPNKVVLLAEPGSGGDAVRSLSPLVQGQAMIDGKAAAHVCTETACLPETDDPQRFVELLRRD
jgi:uncharacterized protein YyaL (SSP411 family)